MEPKEGDFDVTAKLVFDLNLALYLDLVAVLERSGVVTYRQMTARVLDISLNARADGDSHLANALEGIAQGFSGRGDGLSIGLLKAAHHIRGDEAMGDVPRLPDEA